MRLFWLSAAFVALFPCLASAQVYSGKGAAVVGSAMTPEETRRLAFEKARRSALHKFGMEIRSERKLESVSTPDGRVEMTTERIAVLASGNASLVDGSKTTRREVTEAAIRFVVEADFRVEPPAFEQTLKAYRSRSEAKRPVEEVLEAQSRMSDVEGQSVSQLLTRLENARGKLASFGHQFDGKAAAREAKRSANRQKNGLAGYYSAILRHGFPGDVMGTSVRSRVEARGNQVKAFYKTRLQAERYRKLRSVCKTTAAVWERAGRESDVPEISWPVRLFLLGPGGRVLLAFGELGPKDYAGPKLEVDYSSCQPKGMFERHGFDSRWSTTWTATISRKLMRRVEKAALAVASEDVAERLRHAGYRKDGHLWRPSGQPKRPGAFALSRADFRSELRAAAPEEISLLFSDGKQSDGKQ